MAMPNLEQLVDTLLNQAQAEHPGVEFSIQLSAANSLLLPKHADYILRDYAGDGVLRRYNGHTYRDCSVHAAPTGGGSALLDHFVVVGPVANTGPGSDEADTYWGDLRTGEVEKNKSFA